MSFPKLDFFSATEFKHPDQMNVAFLDWLDLVRGKAGTPFRITSDFRTLQENAIASGSSPTSLHLLGRAVDFVPAGWDPQLLFAIMRAVMWTSAFAPGGIELRLVQGPQDRHIHLGCFPDQRPHRLELGIT